MATPENNIKTNIQLFRANNEFSERFFTVINQPNLVQQLNLWLLSDTFSTSKYFGYFVWDNNLSDLVQFFTRDYFAENWTAIIEAFKIAGTFEAYILIIKSAIGNDVDITFASPNPSHLQISISEPTGVFRWGARCDGQVIPVIPDQTQYPNTVMAFEKTISILTVNQTINLLNLLNVSGVFIEVSFITN